MKSAIYTKKSSVSLQFLSYKGHTGVQTEVSERPCAYFPQSFITPIWAYTLRFTTEPLA